MKKGTKILALTLFSLVLISFFIGVVSAETVFDKMKSSLTNIFSGASGISNDVFAQGLLIVLLVLLIYSIEDFMPFFPTGTRGEWIKWVAAAIISILGLAFLPVTDIKGILISYQALGVVLTSFLPFFIMLTFSIKWDTKYPQYTFMSSILWIAFFVYLIFRWFLLPSDAALTWAYPIIALCSLIFLAIKGWIAKLILRSLLKGDMSKYRTLNQEEITAKAMDLYDKADKFAAVGDLTRAQDLRQEAHDLEMWAYSMP
jgi:hypothetical protein